MGQSTLGVLALVVGVAGALVAVVAKPSAVRLSGIALLVMGIVIVGAAVHAPAAKTPLTPIQPAGVVLTSPLPTPNASPAFSPLALPSSFHSPSPSPSRTPPPTPTRTPAPGPTRP